MIYSVEVFIVVSVLAFYSEDTCLNPKSTILFAKIVEKYLKEAEDVHLLSLLK